MTLLLLLVGDHSSRIPGLEYGETPLMVQGTFPCLESSLSSDASLPLFF